MSSHDWVVGRAPSVAATVLAVVAPASGSVDGYDAGFHALLLGILFEFASLASGVLGKQLLRLGHVRGRLYMQVVGVLMQFVMGPVLDVVALAFCPQSVLVLFAGLDAVGTLLLGPIVLGEKLTRGKVAGGMLVAIGTGIAVFYGPRESVEDDGGFEDLLGTLRKPAFVVWALLFASAVVAFSRGVFYDRERCGDCRRGLSFGVLAGMFGGNAWCMRAAVRLFAAERVAVVATSPLMWTMAFGAIVSALSSMWFLVRGMREFETVFLVPVVDGARIVSGALSGFLVMGEGRGIHFAGLSGYLLGIAAVLCGIGALYGSEVSSRSPQDLKVHIAATHRAAAATAGLEVAVLPAADNGPRTSVV